MIRRSTIKTHLFCCAKNKIHTYTISTPRPSQVLTNITFDMIYTSTEASFLVSASSSPCCCDGPELEDWVFQAAAGDMLPCCCDDPAGLLPSFIMLLLGMFMPP